MLLRAVRRRIIPLSTSGAAATTPRRIAAATTTTTGLRHRTNPPCQKTSQQQQHRYRYRRRRHKLIGSGFTNRRRNCSTHIHTSCWINHRIARWQTQNLVTQQQHMSSTCRIWGSSCSSSRDCSSSGPRSNTEQQHAQSQPNSNATTMLQPITITVQRQRKFHTAEGEQRHRGQSSSSHRRQHNSHSNSNKSVLYTGIAVVSAIVAGATAAVIYQQHRREADLQTKPEATRTTAVAENGTMPVLPHVRQVDDNDKKAGSGNCLVADEGDGLAAPQQLQVEGKGPSLQTTQQRHILFRIFLRPPAQMISTSCWYVRLVMRGMRLFVTFGPLFCLYPAAAAAKDICPALYRSWWKIFVYIVSISGPAFTKFAQWASMRQDLFSEDFCMYCTRLQADNWTHSWKETVALLKNEIGEDWETRFLEFPVEPIGSGAIAQVYRATMRGDGDDVDLVGATRPAPRRVAVKVRHPGVTALIQRDIALMQLGAWVLEHIPLLGLKWASVTDAVDQFGGIMEQQLDLRVEAANLLRFQRTFEGVPNVVFPRPVLSMATKRVLVESFEDGIHMSEYIRRAKGARKQHVAKLGLNAFLKMIFKDNFVHSDLHPGNILVRRRGLSQEEGTTGCAFDMGDDDGEGCQGVKRRGGFDSKTQMGEDLTEDVELVLLDAGLVTHLSGRDYGNFVGLFRAIMLGDGAHAARLMLRGATIRDANAKPEKFQEEIQAIVDRFHAERRALARMNLSSIVTDALRAACQCRVKVESNFISIMLGIVVLEGLGRQLDADVDVLQASVPFVARAVVSSLTLSSGASKKGDDSATHMADGSSSSESLGMSWRDLPSLAWSELQVSARRRFGWPTASQLPPSPPPPAAPSTPVH